MPVVCLPEFSRLFFVTDRRPAQSLAGRLSSRRRFGLLSAALAVVLLAVASPVHAQLPATRLASAFPSGAKPGETVDVLVAGTDIDDLVGLHFSHQGITAKQKMAEPGPFDKGPTPVLNTFEVTVAGNVPPGTYEVRANGRYGMSNPRAFVVTELPQAKEVEPNNVLEEASELLFPGETCGQSLQMGDVDWYKFTVPANTRLFIEGLSQQIDSRMDPIVVLYGPTGLELQSSRNAQRGDPSIDFTASAAGEYRLKVYDSRFNGGDDYFYRLRVGSLPHIDFVFPPSGQAGGNRPFTIFGRNLPGGQPAGITLDGRPLEKLSVNIPMPAGAALDTLHFGSLISSESAGIDAVEYRVNSPAGRSNPVLVGVSASPVVMEEGPNDSAAAAQTVAAPCEVAGQFLPERDQDWYQFTAKAGETFVVELISQRMGRPTDASLYVERTVKPAEGEQPEEVAMVATSDDAANTGTGEFNAKTFDPALTFTAPADGTYRVLVRDGYSAVQADPRNVYRLVIRQPLPDFRLVAASGNAFGGSLLLRKGGSAEIPVVAFRRDSFDGEITVTATGLPNGVTCPPVVIGPANDTATLVVSAAENAPAGFGLVDVTGEATLPGGAVKHAARFGAVLWPLTPRPQNQPQAPGAARLSRNLVVSVSVDEVAPVLLQAGADKVWETSRGGILKIPYTLTRRSGFNSPVACVVDELPPNSTAQPFTIAANQGPGEFQINFTANTPPGTYTIRLDGLCQPLPYMRNPDAAKVAAERKAELDKIVVEVTAKNQEAIKAKADADKAATDAQAAVQTATTAKTNADKAEADAATAAKAAADAAVKAKADAAANPGDANLAAAATAAQKAADDAATALKTAIENAVAAKKALDEANVKLEAALKDKAEKDQGAIDAAALLAMGQAAKTAADQRAVQTENAARQQNLNNVYFPSTSVRLKITPAPITMTLGAPMVATKQAAAAPVELPVTIARMYEFADQVTLSVVLPQGVGGLSIPNVAIPNGQTAGKLAIAAAANATEGSHNAIVRGTLAFNGQPIIVEQPVVIKIDKADPATQ